MRDKKLLAEVEKVKAENAVEEQVIDNPSPDETEETAPNEQARKKKVDGKLIVAEEIEEGHVSWPARESDLRASHDLLSAFQFASTFMHLAVSLSGSYSYSASSALSTHKSLGLGVNSNNHPVCSLFFKRTLLETGLVNMRASRILGTYQFTSTSASTAYSLRYASSSTPSHTRCSSSEPFARHALYMANSSTAYSERPYDGLILSQRRVSLPASRPTCALLTALCPTTSRMSSNLAHPLSASWPLLCTCPPSSSFRAS